MSQRAAAKVLTQYWDGKLPVNVIEIAKRMGIRVEVSQFNNATSGEITLHENNQVVMRINTSEVNVRQRFTAAHELGHFALGHLSAHGKTQFRDTSNQFKMSAEPNERAANQFAAALLMPEDALKFVISKGVARTLPDLARLFGVSQAAMQYRAKELGIFNNV